MCIISILLPKFYITDFFKSFQKEDFAGGLTAADGRTDGQTGSMEYKPQVYSGVTGR